MKTDLSVKIGKVTFKNPVTVASGTFGSSDEYAEFFDLSRLGAITAKTVTLNAREGNPMPRIYETPSGMLNSIGLENKGVKHFIENKLPFLKSLKTGIIVSIAGADSGEMEKITEELETHDEISAVEINFSCPNVSGKVGLETEPKVVGKITKGIRKHTEKLLIAKFSPETPDFDGAIKSALDNGAEALSLINTVRAMAVDVDNRVPRIAKVIGGLSGPAIRPIALRYVYEAKKKFNKPIIACGGIITAKDALEFIIVGAEMVSVGTGNYYNPMTSIRLLEDLEAYMIKNKIANLGDIRGSLKT